VEKERGSEEERERGGHQLAGRVLSAFRSGASVCDVRDVSLTGRV